ncbi:MAG: T9SS type A sorting domain-containing protein [Bacteroidales bacterium]|nr:T9SS type A sorting domain-containing protein [Bacteroidales bacterium]
MKKILLILAICLYLLTSLAAQNIWKPINVNMYGGFMVATSDGSILAGADVYGGTDIFRIYRTQDDGATWQLILSFSDIQGVRNGFTITDEGRIYFIGEEWRQHGGGRGIFRLFYSDDNGDTWLEKEEPVDVFGGEIGGFCAPTNDLLLIWTPDGTITWTVDGGETWDAVWAFNNLIYDLEISDMIVNASGDIYTSIYHPFLTYGVGIYHSSLSNMSPELVAFEGIAVQNLEFDPEGNVVAGGGGEFQQQPGFYLVPDKRFVIADNGIIYDLHDVGENNNHYTVLRYSGNHGETFYEYGEALQIQEPIPGGDGDGYIWLGRDGHLYFYGYNDYKKSVFNTNDIHYIEGEVVVLPDAFAFGNYPHGAGQAIRVDDDHIYPVTVDGFRPDPTDLSRLIVRYDTIPMGATIGAFGTIREMHDYVGDSQNVLDIQQTTAHYNDAIISMLNPEEDKVKIRLPKPPYTSYYITINGEKQDWPLVFNGVPYNNTDLLIFIGHCDIMIDQYANQFYGMELADIQPFKDCTFQLDDGWLTTDFWAQPCLSCPCEEDENQHFLTFIGPGDYIIPYYPMHNGRLFKETYINNDIFREGMHVDLKGIQYLRYDMPGEEVNVVELVEMDTDEETTLTGRVEWAPMPYTSYVPLPGLIIAFVSNGRTYYLDNDQDPYDDWFLVGNDTIHIGQEITATFTSKLLIDNGLNFYYRINITQAEPIYDNFPIGTEWYYEITNDNGSVTYQYLECAADTTINDHPIHILVIINTLYDKSDIITHEYIYEEYNKVYWWNKTLGEFTTLYDFSAEVGDEWEIKVGNESITMHVDAVEPYDYEGQTLKLLRVSDANDIFSGEIVCGIGHLTSFFPEKLMSKGYRVENIRCFWQDGELIYQNGDQDCDEIYEQHHLGVDEIDAENEFVIYPNPSHNVLFVKTCHGASLQSEYRITNIMGQTLMTGEITSENQQIDVSSLPKGIYFITVNNASKIFVIK